MSIQLITQRIDPEIMARHWANSGNRPAGSHRRAHVFTAAAAWPDSPVAAACAFCAGASWREAPPTANRSEQPFQIAAEQPIRADVMPLQEGYYVTGA
jgi:hypothetical protein